MNSISLTLRFFLVIYFISNGDCFLMNSSTPHETGNLYGYQNLVSLIVDEKRERYQLESRLNNMEQSYLEVTKQLQKDRNNRQQLIDENSRLNTLLMNLTTDKEKLQLKFENLQSNYNTLKAGYETLSASNQNLSEETSKILAAHAVFEEKVNNLTKEQGFLENKYHVLLEQYLSVTSRNQETFVNKTVLTAELSEMRTNLSSEILRNAQKIKNYGVQLGFSLKDAIKSSNLNRLKFGTSRYNSNNMFNMSSGEFVCRRAGLYFFSATIVREPGIIESYCSIGINNLALQTTVGYGCATTGYSSGTAAIVYHLDVGDKVYLGWCHGIDHIYWSSSFNGFLIAPDQ